MKKGKILIIGAGSIGFGWAIKFITHEYEVEIIDSDIERKSFLKNIKSTIILLNQYGIVKRKYIDIELKIKFLDKLPNDLNDYFHIQECINESLVDKKKLYRNLLSKINNNTISIASSSSFLTISEIANDFEKKGQCLVAHPGNPPYLLDVVEIVPAPFTSKHIIKKLIDICDNLDMLPILLKKEKTGFVFNRLQGSILNEAYNLLNEDVVNPEDIDKIVSNGLGLRWAFFGPFEVFDLNTSGGIEKHAQIMGPKYKSIASERGMEVEHSDNLIKCISNYLKSKYRKESKKNMIKTRDHLLMSLISLKIKNKIK